MRLAVAQHVHQRALIEQVAGVQGQVVATVLEPLEGLRGGSPDHPVNLVALLQQELREVAPVLASDACYERAAVLGHGLAPYTSRAGGRVVSLSGACELDR